MACSRFEYVKKFEEHPTLLAGCWAVVRLDGRAFTKFTAAHGYEKPNDARGLLAMNDAAACVLRSFSDIIVGYGQSDEFSFVLRREARVFGRRADKILSTIVSLFSAEFVRAWMTRFAPDGRLQWAPSFDARIVLYPTTKHLRDYLAWRQVDVHVNNLFNTTFWALVASGITQKEAERELKGTTSADKNEILFSKFNVNYNSEPPMFRKGSVLMRPPPAAGDKDEDEDMDKAIVNKENWSIADGIVICHDDMIRNSFWESLPHLLNPPDTNPPPV